MTERKPNVLAVIPARGGSKGLPRKNMLDLGGKPLIAWSIEAALQSTLVARVLVSTDDEEIASIARYYGAEVPFLRPKELATDTASINDVVGHACNHLTREGFEPEFVVTLYPTHPFRQPGLIDELTAVGLAGYSPVLTCRRIRFSEGAFHYSENGRLKPLIPRKSDQQGAETHRAYRSYGLYVGTRRTLSSIPYNHLVDDPLSLIDIDSMTDLELARAAVNADTGNKSDSALKTR